jgi:signal transduction histidine kinase
VSTGAQCAPQPANLAPPQERTPLAHLLHALNQPLTGLQCSLELAVAGPRSPEQYLRTLREGLEFTLRMRILVEAVRELADMQEDAPRQDEVVLLDALLRETADDLSPVAQTQKVRLLITWDSPLPVRSSRRHLAAVMFRSLESALSMTREGGDFQIVAEKEQNDAVFRLSWSEAQPLEHSPFSRAELGLLIAQAGWERAGAEWLRTKTGDVQTCTVRLPLAATQACLLEEESK